MIRRRDLEAHLRSSGASLLRHGAKHDVWIAPGAVRPVTLPRHSRIPRTTARAICRQLGVPPLT
jgi:mRNA interferase HicA